MEMGHSRADPSPQTLASPVASPARSRPVSIYDNIRDSIALQLARNNEVRELRELRVEREEEQENPSQEQLLNTTVPQNIGGVKIAGTHVPTRNSLRHSRMIVMGRIGQVAAPKKTPTPVLHSHKLGKALTGLQTLLGLAICTLALWLLLWAPNIRTRDNPYWSGLTLALSGIIGLILLCCFKEIPRARNYCSSSLKVTSISLSAVAGACCLTACAFAIIHLISLQTMECEPLNQLNATCSCEVANKTRTFLPIKSYHYVDLSCPEVRHILGVLLIFSAGANCIGGVIAIWYVCLHWTSRYAYNYRKATATEESNTFLST